MLQSLILVYASFLTFTAALNPIGVRNNVFYDLVTNKRFYMIGVDYQPGGASGVKAGADPLSDIDICRRDVFLFQSLAINTVRVYSVDNTLNHDACMSLYNTAGIYLLLDVNSPIDGQHLNRNEPWTTYNAIYAEHVFRTLEAFGGYENTLGFLSGNEVINDDISAIASPPYIKALTRDMKAYIAKHLDRSIPVGYSAADNIDYRIETATYMACGSDSDGVNDFYAINSYQWCGQQTIQSSGYDNLISQFSGFHIPLFFSEYGCNEVKPRTFGEVEAVYSSDMTPNFSGGLVYEFSQQDNDYGLVSISSDGTVRLLPDFVALQTQYAQISTLPSDIPTSQAIQNACPATSSYKFLNGSLTLPSLSEIDELITSGVAQNKGVLASSVSLDQASATILNVNGGAITNKQITSASSTGTFSATITRSAATTKITNQMSKTTSKPSSLESTAEKAAQTTASVTSSATTQLSLGRTSDEYCLGMLVICLIAFLVC